jgi:iron(III) transport system substrate-binding protein
LIRRPSIGALATLAAAVGLAIGASVAAGASAATSLTIYSGREETLVKPLMERFTKETGIELKIRYGSSLSLATTLIEEGSSSPADVFFATEPGTLGLLAGRGLLRRLPSATVAKVPSRFATPSRRWVGTSGRSRVIAYNTEQLTPAQLPKSVWELTNPRWKGKVGLPPTNASFQSFLGAMLYLHGEDRTRDWLRGLQDNGVKFYARNSAVVEALSRGEIQLGLVNHYYVYNHLAQDPNAAVRNHWLRPGDPGTLVLTAGVGIVTASKNGAAAQRFVDFLLSRWAQRFIARGPGAAEYPLVKGVLPRPGLPPLAEIRSPKYNLGRLAVDLPEAVKLLLELGYIK